MDKSRHSFIVILNIEVLILILQLIFMMKDVHRVQGNGRVVNYAGIIRGATQRLVKNELYDKQDDEQIKLLDEILLGLQTGKGALGLTVIDDDYYQSKLSILADEWELVKSIIYKYREDPREEETLYKISEIYFTAADIVVTAAEKYSDGIAKRLRVLEITISVTMVLMLGLLFIQISKEIKKNRILKQIAYIDPNTGLPNKRSCEEKMEEVFTPDQEVCCLLFDLNNLKLANDTFGHYVGDVLISSFATLLRKHMPDNMFVGRLGGDEFIGVQINADKKEINTKIKELEEAAGQTNVGTKRQKIIISFAYGCVFSSEHPGYSIKSLMDIADKKMYQNKLDMKGKK